MTYCYILVFLLKVGTPGEVELNRHLGELALNIQKVSQPGTLIDYVTI